MYCANCGSDEKHGGQFCRVCGLALRAPQAALETAPTPPLGPREEIARAVAYKISQLDSAKALAKVTEDVLPELEKFLETPQEKRLRRMRAGVITAAIGLGATAFFALMGALGDSDMLPMMGLGIIVFLIGLGLVINAKWFTVLPEYEQLNALPKPLNQFLDAPNTKELPPTPVRAPYVSVTEHTTHRLPEPVRRTEPQS